MQTEIASIVSPAEKLNQLRQLLDANGVTRPHTMWMNGEQLRALMGRIGKFPHHRDGPLKPTQHYKYNLEFNRFYEAEPWKPTW